MKGGLHGFQGNRGEKQSLLTRYKGQRGGGATGHCLSMEGIIKILQSFGGGESHKVNFRVIQQKSSHPLPRQYI